MTELADRLEARLNRNRHGDVDPWLGIRIGPGICEDVIEAVAALRGVSGDEMDDFIRAVLADNNPRIDEPYATVAKWIRRLNRRRKTGWDKATIEECAKIAEAKAQDYLSPQYATNQPMGSVCERFACGQVASAIRDLAGNKRTPLVEITRGQKVPCGECHLRLGETCDICDAKQGSGS